MLAAAEAVIACVLESCGRPAIEPRDILKAPAEFVAPLVAFTRACRSEREAMLRQI